MFVAYDLGDICRAEGCERVDLHAKHAVPAIKTDRPPARYRARPVWTQADPRALARSICKATSKRVPTHFSAIASYVRNDYGQVTDRTVYRGLAKLVDRGCVLKLDVGFSFAVYLRPKSPLEHDHELIRDYILGIVEMNATTSTARLGSHYARAAP